MWFFGSLSVSGRKKGGSKKKVAKIRLFFWCFFLKNDQILTNTKTFKIRFFFTETHKQVHNILLNTFQMILGWISISGHYFGIFTALVEKKLFFGKNWNFFLRGFTLVFDKNNFFFLAFLEKFVILWKKIITFWPLLSSLSYLPILLKKW